MGVNDAIVSVFFDPYPMALRTDTISLIPRRMDTRCETRFHVICVIPGYRCACLTNGRARSEHTMPLDIGCIALFAHSIEAHYFTQQFKLACFSTAREALQYGKMFPLTKTL